MLQSCLEKNSMAICDVLVVAGTHGNELNAPWLLDQWEQQPGLIPSEGLEIRRLIGNPEARKAGRRYIDRDLNRCFRSDLLQGEFRELEPARARELLSLHGPDGGQPCRVAIDLHSTTSGMGNSLVIYGRRPADLALAALVQGELGLPVYLHEGDPAQTGFLVESWPCGLVIEVGPVPQGVLKAQIVRQTRLALSACLNSLATARSGSARAPRCLVVHRHLGSVDFPRDEADAPMALPHPQLQDRDWRRLSPGQAVFETADGRGLIPEGMGAGIPVFINEAAYAEKRIAFSLTEREVLRVEPIWLKALEDLLSCDQL